MKVTLHRRRSRVEIIAMLFAADIKTFESYQSGRTKVPVYTEGQSYYVALRKGEKAPEGFGTWVKLGDGSNYTIFMSSGETED